MDELFHYDDKGSRAGPSKTVAPVYQITKPHTPEDCTGKAVPVRAMKAYDKVMVQLNVVITSALEDGWSTSYLAALYPVPTKQKAGWTPQPVGTFQRTGNLSTLPQI